jgi:signal peptidase I
MEKKKSREELKSIGWTLLLILFLRGFVAEPFKIPSGSMIPSLLIGDHLFVAKSSYDLGIPFTDIKIARIADPKRGDVVVFEYPNNESNPSKKGQYYIKRLIGLPGDRIAVRGGVPHLNGLDTPVEEAKIERPYPSSLRGFQLNPNHQLFLETLPGTSGPHWVQRYPYRVSNLEEAKAELKKDTGQDCIEVGKSILGLAPLAPTLLNEICEFTVPEDHYFFMGDNRDDSADSREWGFVQRKSLKGRALFIWLSLLQEDSGPEEGGPILRWSRLGLGIK